MATKQYVKAEMNIGDAVYQYPVAADIMMSYGLHCVGCHVNAFESIGEGALVHGMDEDDVDEMIKEINEAIDEREQQKQSGKPLFVTKRAVEKIGEFRSKEKKKDVFLRIEVAEGGISGFQYKLNFEQKPRDGDHVIKEGDEEIRIDDKSFGMMKGAVLDYVDGLEGSGFKIDNPNAVSHCGCGKSFA